MADPNHQQIVDQLEAALAETRSHEAEFIGLTESEAALLAARLGIELRKIRDDHTALYLDLRSARITVDLRTGKVTSAAAG